MITSFARLDEDSLVRQAHQIARQDPHLARILALYGPPPLWARPPGFPSLIHIILEQQVSLASAKAAFDRLQAAVSPLTPAGLLALDDAQLKAIGFSRQKTRYARLLAQELLSGGLDLAALEGLDDDDVRRALVRLKGIGPWTAEIYLLMVLCRPDTWPTGDLALARAAQQVLGIEQLPSPEVMAALGERWRPWRAVAARMLWHYYLSQ